MDTQTIEVLGRNRLVTELLLAGAEVAVPARDRGIDLIAYLDLASKVKSFIAVPIQMKAASTKAFSINRKYSKISNLLLVYVWGLSIPGCTETYALTYPEALAIAETVGWTKTVSWEKGEYVTSSPSRQICELLKPFRMTPEAWMKRLAGISALLEPANSN